MRRSILLAVLLTSFTGCTWSDLDAEFLAALPRRAELKVRPPTRPPSQQALTSSDLGTGGAALQAKAFLELDETATRLNAMIDGLTGGLDLVRQFPPAERAADARTWGPWADKDHPGLETRVVISREPGRYEYAVEWRRQGSADAYVSVITGTFEGEQAAGGTGEFTLDFDKARVVGIAGADVATHRSLTLDYVHKGEAVEVRLADVEVDGKVLRFRHARNADESGAFSYDLELEAYLITADARWLPDRAGRVDGVGFSEFFNTEVAHYTDCWDSSLEVVFHFQDYDCDGPATPSPGKPPCTFGDAALCKVAKGN